MEHQLNLEDMINLLTKNRVYIQVSNLQVSDKSSLNELVYEPSARITIGNQGRMLMTFIGDDIKTELSRAVKWCKENNLIKE